MQASVAKAKVKVKVRARTVPMAKVNEVKDTGGDVPVMLPLRLPTQANLVKNILLKKTLDKPNGNQKTRMTMKNFSGHKIKIENFIADWRHRYGVVITYVDDVTTQTNVDYHTWIGTAYSRYDICATTSGHSPRYA